MTLETKFNVRDRVFIDPLKQPGRIINIWYGEYWLQYKIRYFDGSILKMEYFLEDELSMLQQGKQIPFHPVIPQPSSTKLL